MKCLRSFQIGILMQRLLVYVWYEPHLILSGMIWIRLSFLGWRCDGIFKEICRVLNLLFKKSIFPTFDPFFTRSGRELSNITHMIGLCDFMTHNICSIKYESLYLFRNHYVIISLLRNHNVIIMECDKWLIFYEYIMSHEIPIKNLRLSKALIRV